MARMPYGMPLSSPRDEVSFVGVKQQRAAYSLQVPPRVSRKHCWVNSSRVDGRVRDGLLEALVVNAEGILGGLDWRQQAHALDGCGHFSLTCECRTHAEPWGRR